MLTMYLEHLMFFFWFRCHRDMSLLTTISIQVICAHMNIYRLTNIYFKSVIRMLLESDLKESDLMCSIEIYSLSFLLSLLRARGGVWCLTWGPQNEVITPSSEGGCLSSDMLRAKIDLRQPMFLLKFTEDRDRFRQGSRNTRFQRFRIQDRTPPMAIEVAEVDPWRRRSLLQRASAPPAVVPRGLGISEGSLQIKPGRQAAAASPVSGIEPLTAQCCCGVAAVWTVCVVHTKYAPPHCRGGEAGVTQGLRIALSCSVEPSAVHEGEKEPGYSASISAHLSVYSWSFHRETHFLTKELDIEHGFRD